MTKISWWKTNFGEEEIERVVQSIRHKNVSQGKVTADFENKLADFLEVGHVVAASSGSSSLLMSLMAIGIKPSDEVILPNRTWIATAHAVHLLGAKVVLVDVEKKRLAKNTLVTTFMSNGGLEKAINNFGGKLIRTNITDKKSISFSEEMVVIPDGKQPESVLKDVINAK